MDRNKIQEKLNNGVDIATRSAAVGLSPQVCVIRADFPAVQLFAKESGDREMIVSIGLAMNACERLVGGQLISSEEITMISIQLENVAKELYRIGEAGLAFAVEFGNKLFTGQKNAGI